MNSFNRRWFIGTAAAGAFAAPSNLRVNSARLRDNLEALSAFGRPEGGTFADGVSRVAYSEADLAGRAYVMGLLKFAGLQPHIDAAGNILARRPGTDPTLAPVLFGSHIDSVPNGGNFDGDLGSLAAIEVIRTLNEAKVTTKRPQFGAIHWHPPNFRKALFLRLLSERRSKSSGRTGPPPVQGSFSTESPCWRPAISFGWSTRRAGADFDGSYVLPLNRLGGRCRPT